MASAAPMPMAETDGMPVSEVRAHRLHPSPSTNESCAALARFGRLAEAVAAFSFPRPQNDAGGGNHASNEASTSSSWSSSRPGPRMRRTLSALTIQAEMDGSGRTALHAAADACDARAVAALLRADGASTMVSATDRVRRGCASTPFVRSLLLPSTLSALDRRVSDVVSLHLPQRLRRTALHVAASRGCADCVQLLLQAGSAPDRPDIVGKTPLHLAAARGALGCVAALHSAWAALDAAEAASHRRPLHLAAAAGGWEVVVALAGAGADVDAADQDGRTPLHLAAARGHRDVVAALLDAGADAKRTDKARFIPGARQR